VNKILKLKDFGSINESRTLTKEEIEDYFIDYLDTDRLIVTKGYVEGGSKSEWWFFTDIARVDKNSIDCWEAKISLNYKKSKIRGREAITMNSFESLEESIAEIKQFYARIKSEPSFYIDTKYDDLNIYFYILGDKVNQSQLDKKEEIKNYLSKIGELYKKATGLRRISLKNSNFLEILIPKKEGWLMENGVRNAIRRMADGNYVANTETRQQLVDIFDEIRQKGYRVEISGGDYQVVVKLK